MFSVDKIIRAKKFFAQATWVFCHRFVNCALLLHLQQSVDPKLSITTKDGNVLKQHIYTNSVRSVLIFDIVFLDNASFEFTVDEGSLLASERGKDI